MASMCRQITLTREMSRLWRAGPMSRVVRGRAGTPTGSNLRPLSGGQANKCPLSPPSLPTCAGILIVASNLRSADQTCT